RGGDRARSLRSQRYGRPATSVFLGYRAILADLGLCWLAWHDGGLASYARGGRQLCHPAISDLELSTPLAFRRFFIRGVDGLPDCLPQLLASAKDLDDDNPARPAGRTCSHRKIAGYRIDRRPGCAGSG